MLTSLKGAILKLILLCEFAEAFSHDLTVLCIWHRKYLSHSSVPWAGFMAGHTHQRWLASLDSALLVNYFQSDEFAGAFSPFHVTDLQ